MWLFYVPVPVGEGELIAKKLIESKVCKCVNLVEGKSLFFWEGSLKKNKESILIAKTTNPDSFEKLVREIHPYKIPAIVRWAVEVNDDYEKWLKN